MNHSETEIKLPISDLSAAPEQVKAQSAELRNPRYLEDNFLFDDHARTLRNNKKLLRVRIVHDTVRRGILTFKGVSEIEDGVRKRKEIECEVDPAEDLITLLNELGYESTFRYQKYRTIYIVENVLEICIDETPIGNFFELEGPIEKIHDFAARLGYQRNQYVTGSYVALYLQWCQKNHIQPTEMTFQEKSDL